MVPESKFQQRNVFELLCGGQSQYFQAPNTAEWCVSTRTLRDLKKCTRRIEHASSSHLWLCRVYYILDMLKKRQGEVESTNRCANTPPALLLVLFCVFGLYGCVHCACGLS